MEDLSWWSDIMKTTASRKATTSRKAARKSNVDQSSYVTRVERAADSVAPAFNPWLPCGYHYVYAGNHAGTHGRHKIGRGPSPLTTRSP